MSFKKSGLFHLSCQMYVCRVVCSINVPLVIDLRRGKAEGSGMRAGEDIAGIPNLLLMSRHWQEAQDIF